MNSRARLCAILLDVAVVKQVIETGDRPAALVIRNNLGHPLPHRASVKIIGHETSDNRHDNAKFIDVEMAVLTFDGQRRKYPLDEKIMAGVEDDSGPEAVRFEGEIGIDDALRQNRHGENEHLQDEIAFPGIIVREQDRRPMPHRPDRPG